MRFSLRAFSTSVRDFFSSAKRLMLIETPLAVGTISLEPWVIVHVRISTRSLPLNSRMPMRISWNLFFLNVAIVLSIASSLFPRCFALFRFASQIETKAKQTAGVNDPFPINQKIKKGSFSLCLFIINNRLGPRCQLINHRQLQRIGIRRTGKREDDHVRHRLRGHQSIPLLDRDVFKMVRQVRS